MIFQKQRPQYSGLDRLQVKARGAASLDQTVLNGDSGWQAFLDGDRQRQRRGGRQSAAHPDAVVAGRSDHATRQPHLAATRPHRDGDAHGADRIQIAEHHR